MIEIKNLHKSYRRGKEIIPDLNLSFGETGLTMIVGKSGCGKTTLLNIVGAMDLDFEGDVVVDGLNLKQASYKQIVDYRNFTTAFVFQKNSLFEFLTVEENLKLCMNIQNNKASISEALEKVGLKGFEHKKVKSLSGGEKQRVAIARALIKNCKIIFADEPTSALDTKNAHKIFQLFKEISKDKLVVLVTHDLKKAVLYADRIVRFVDGVPVEDTTYNEVSTEAKKLPQRKTKKFALVPIFKNHLKKGFAINLFTTLLLMVVITIVNLAIAGTKVKNEYDYYGTEQQVEFNVDRALDTHIKNNINLYNVVKNVNTENAYTYLENGLAGDTRLNDVDKLILSNELKNESVHLGTRDSKFNKLVIDTVSNQFGSSISVDGANKYWEGIGVSNYSYYLYNSNNNYDLLEGGRLPNESNKEEILITDVVAWHYLNKLVGFQGSKDNPEDYSMIYDEDFVIYDTQGVYYENTTGSTLGIKEYYIGIPKHFKVVGIIKTGLLDYYKYDGNRLNYVFYDHFKNQDNDRYAIFMNSVKSQPFGYVVLQEHLDTSINNPFYYDDLMMNDVCISNGEAYYSAKEHAAKSFIGSYDYTTNPAEMYYRERYGLKGTHNMYELAGHEDNLQLDVSNRIITISTNEKKLMNNEVIISKKLAQTLFPELSFNSNSEIRKNFINIANKKITLSYDNGYGKKNVTLQIVGISKETSYTYYISNDMYKKLYADKYGQAETMTVDLTGKSIKERKVLMERLYTLGYSLAPVDLMPGSYLEFVPGKGETYSEVDGEELKALYPNYSIVEKDGEYYFENNGLLLGMVEVNKNNQGEIESLGMVYMSSTMVKHIALDESYITKNIGNLSLYYLFSEYYTFPSTVTGNYILEIMGSMYTFLFGMALVIAIGFIYLKENKEKDTMTKLSMLGVRPKHIYLIHFITYSVLAIIMAIGSVALTYIFVQVINGMFTYSFDSGATIHRVRLMFEQNAIYTSIIISIGIFVLSMISSIIVTYRARK